MFHPNSRLLLAAHAIVVIAITAPQASAQSPRGDVDLAPAIAFQKFLRVARKTSDFEDILPFLPSDQQEFYRQRERAFDGDAVRDLLSDSDRFRGMAGLLSKTPYERGLDEYRGIAKRVKKYLGMEIKGDAAMIKVDAQAGEERITATVSMIRERGGWKFADFEVDLDL